MAETDYPGHAFGGLDDTAALAYQHVVRVGRCSVPEISAELGLSPGEAARAVQDLIDLRLLRPMPGRREILVPISPDAAAADLVGPTEQQIRQLQQLAAEARSGMLALLPAYFESRRQRDQREAIDVISDVELLRTMLDDQGARCTTDVMTAQPGGARPADRLNRARPRTLDRLGQGIRVRHLYQHTVRNDLATAAYIRTVSAAGAEVRTTDQLIDRVIIYDRKVAFLREQEVEGREPGAVVVREPTLVAFLCKLYEHMWSTATPFNPGADETSNVADDVKRSVIKLMAQGYKDEMVARRLGMSVRTCRRHISQIMEELESASRFQAGFNAATSGILDEDPGDTPVHIGE